MTSIKFFYFADVLKDHLYTVGVKKLFYFLGVPPCSENSEETTSSLLKTANTDKIDDTRSFSNGVDYSKHDSNADTLTFTIFIND